MNAPGAHRSVEIGNKQALTDTRYINSSGTDTKTSGNGQLTPFNVVIDGNKGCRGSPLQLDGMHDALDSLYGQGHVDGLLFDEDEVEANQDDPLWHQYASDDEDAVPGSLRSLTKRRTAAAIPTAPNKIKEKKKMGRPCAYQGNPDSPHLREEDRRKLKRRLANRESARRVRQKRNQRKVELEAQMEKLQQEHSELQEGCMEAEKGRLRLMSQLSHMQEMWSTATVESARLLSEVTALRNAATVNAPQMLHTHSEEQDEPTSPFTPRSSFKSSSTSFPPSPFAHLNLQLGMQNSSSAAMQHSSASAVFVSLQGGTNGCLTEAGMEWAPEADDWEALFGQTSAGNAV